MSHLHVSEIKRKISCLTFCVQYKGRNYHYKRTTLSCIVQYLLHSCTAGLLHSCTVALLYSCTVALFYSCTDAQLHCCTVALLNGCPAEQLLCFIVALLYSCIVYYCTYTHNNYVALLS